MTVVRDPRARRQPMPPASWAPCPTTRDTRPILPFGQIERDTRRVAASRIAEMSNEELGYPYPVLSPRGLLRLGWMLGLLALLVAVFCFARGMGA